MGYLRLRDASLPAPRAPRLGRAAAGEGLFNLERKLSTRRSHWTRKPHPDGVSHISLGCNPGNSPGKTNLRSEGTPHSLRVSDIDPGPMPKRRSERRSAPRPGSATHGYKRSGYETDGAGGDAATVAGYAGPGFHTWPSGHIPQDTAPKPLLRSRPHAKKSFGEAFGAATGVSDPRLQKIRGARATTLGPQIRNDYAGKLISRRGHIGQTPGSPAG